MKKYLIKHKDLNKLLKKLNEFTNTFERFVMKHHNYSYETSISINENNIWECKIEIKDESQNISTIEENSSKNGTL